MERDKWDAEGQTRALQAACSGSPSVGRPLIAMALFRSPSHVMAQSWQGRRVLCTGPCFGYRRQAPAASRPACQKAASSRVAVRKVAASWAKRAEPPRRAASAPSDSISVRMNP